MIKNHNSTIEHRIKKIILLSSTIIILIVSTIIGVILIKTEYNNLKNHINNFKNTLIENEKFYIKTTIENIKNDIRYEEKSIIDNKKNRIKKQSIIAYNLAYSLYEKTKKLSKKEQINFIKSSLRQISHQQQDINYFIINTKGVLILNSENPGDENKLFYNFKDINNFKFINAMIKSPTEKQNFIEYFWYKPNSVTISKKISYVRHLEELDIIIGSGSFMQTSKAELKKNIIKKINNLGFNKEQFFLLYDIKSLTHINETSKIIVSKHINATVIDDNAMRDLLQKSNYNGNKYILYDSNKKLLYGIFIKDLRYFLAVGIKLNHIYNIIEEEQQISFNNLYVKTFSLLVIIFFVILLFFILSFFFTKKIEILFGEYRKRVKENEEKYALLFNHSNDGFIISHLKNNQAMILSLNNTAIQTIKYSSKEILYQNFFYLFNNLDIDEIYKNKSLFKTVNLLCKDKSIKTVELNLITYEYEEQILLFASLRDITERTILKIEKEKQENILIQKSKMATMGEMIGNIAHQWRQPLSQISGLFFDIESAYDYKELNKKYLTNRVNEANDLLEYMSRTIDDFRNFFNPKAMKEDFYIDQCVQKALKLAGSTLSYYNIKINVNIPKNIKINGYKNEYAQAVMNIISNAKDIFIDRRIDLPQIKIYLNPKNNSKLYIEDNAGGIKDENIDKIFDPYFTTKFEFGTGIGLYMTKLIIEEKMNGKIEVTNGKNGAIFIIQI